MDRVRAWVLLTALGVVAGCVRLVAGEGSPSLEATLERVGQWAIWCAVLSAVAVALWSVVSEVRRRRAAQREVILQDLTSAAVSVTGSHPKGHTVRVAKWSKLLPRRIVVRYPKRHDPEGAAARLASAISDAAPDGAAPRGWKATHLPLRHRYVLVPKPQIDQESQTREEAVQRAEKIVKKTLAPGCRSVSVGEWDDAHNPARLTALFEPSPRMSSDRFQAAAVRVISDSFPGRWAAEWDHEKDRVTFVIRPELPDYLRRPLNVPTRTDRLVLRYGQAEGGHVQEWDLDGTKPHGLVVGPTGGGKTYCLRAMALDGISQGMTVYGLDPKRIELMGLIGVPGVAEIATDPEAMEGLIYRMRELMDERYKRIEAREITRKELEPVLFILDEFFILRMRLNKSWVGRGEKGKVNPVLGEVSELLALARSARIHCVLGIQRPDVEFLGDGAARDNVGHRVALGQISSMGSSMMFETPDAGLDLPDVPGRATASGPRGKPQEIQVWAVPDPDPHANGTRSAEDQQLLDSLLAGARPALTETPQLEAVPAKGDVPPTEAEPVDEDGAVEQPAGDGELLDTTGSVPVVADDPPEQPTPAVQQEEAQESSSQSAEWDEVPAEVLVVGDTVRIEGESVVLEAAEWDELEEDYVQLEWADGTVSLPSSEVVARARIGTEPQAA